MRRFYAPKSAFTADKIVLGQEEARHLGEVLRLRADEEVRVFDGEGGEFVCRVETITKKGAILGIGEKISPRCPESALDLTLAVALTKGEKFELVIQKAVELGVMRLAPIQTERCDVKPKDPEKRHERWDRIVIESSKQCGRATLMQIDPLVAFDEFIATEEAQTRLLFTERDGESLKGELSGKTMIALIGPEGGWSDAELESAKRAGITLVTLGGRILRAETAAIAITAVLQSKFGDLG